GSAAGRGASAVDPTDSARSTLVAPYRGSAASARRARRGSTRSTLGSAGPSRRVSRGSSRSALVAPNRGSGRSGVRPGAGGGGSRDSSAPNREPPNREPPNRDSPPGSASGARRRDSPL